jgi:hypothetical protein
MYGNGNRRVSAPPPRSTLPRHIQFDVATINFTTNESSATHDQDETREPNETKLRAGHIFFKKVAQVG